MLDDPNTPIISLASTLPYLDALAHGPDSHDHVITAITEAQALIHGRTKLSEDEATDISIRLGTVLGTAQPILDVDDVLALARANGHRAKHPHALLIADDPIGREFLGDAAKEDALTRQILGQLQAAIAA